MMKRQTRGMQAQPIDCLGISRIRFSVYITPIHFIADDRMSDVRTVYSKLIRSTGYRFQFQQGRFSHSFQDSELRFGLPAALHYAPSRPPVRISADWRAD